MSQKPYTQYECASGEVGRGHSSVWTGARPSNRTETCSCGQPLVEVVPDGYCYKVVFETIDTHQAAEMEGRYGRGVWAKLSGDEWNALRWLPPVTSDNGSPNILRDQYRRLFQQSRTHEQPIRNVRFFRTHNVLQQVKWEEIVE